MMEMIIKIYSEPSKHFLGGRGVETGFFCRFIAQLTFDNFDNPGKKKINIIFRYFISSYANSVLYFSSFSIFFLMYFRKH